MAAAIQSGSMSLTFTAINQNPIGSLSVPQDNPTIVQKTSYNGGTGANKFNLLYYATLALVASTPQTLDLTTGLTDAFGNALVFTTNGVKGICIINLATTSAFVLKVGGAATNAWIGTAAPNAGPFNGVADIQIIGAGGKWMQESPIDSFGVSATSKSLKLDPGTNSFSATVIIWG
jgi:hypothetical protein